MAAEPLSVAVLGLGPPGRLLLEAAETSGLFRIKAVADVDRQRAECTAAQYRCDAYTDYRQLIVQSQLDALFVAADIHTCDEYVKAAIRRKFNILKLAPPARTFAEALELTELAKSEDVRFVVANPLRYCSSFRIAKVWIAESRISQPFLITAQVQGTAAERATWQSDPVLAGGGVLLHDGFGIIDQILRSFPIPQRVYTLAGSQAPDRQQRLRLTEDTAVVSMEFTDALVGSLVAVRGNGVMPEPTHLTVHGKDGLLTVSRDRVFMHNFQDGTRQTQEFQEEDRDVMVRLLEDFACYLRCPDQSGDVSNLAENLKNMAVLESAYLSARTGAPEEPDRVLQQARNYLPLGVTKA
jgi:predicted dehydrogenase